MESPLSSPEKSVAGTLVCKVTYLERKKKKRTSSNPIDSDTDTSSISKPNIPPTMTTADADAASPSSESTTSKGPKKVEISFPGPSSKRPRPDTKESLAPATSSARKKTDSFEFCIHTCNPGGCKSHKHQLLWKKGGGLSRHLKNPNSHPHCSDICPGRNTTIKEATKILQVGVSQPEGYEPWMLEGLSHPFPSIVPSQEEDGSNHPNAQVGSSNDPQSDSKVEKATHVRSASSISSMDRVAQLSGDALRVTKKPLSTRKPKSKVKSVTAEDDDNVSVADSSTSVKFRRNEAERVEYFQNQPECGKMEPHHVQCLRCGKSVYLGRKQTYTVRPWEIHRARCDQKPAQTVAVSTTPDKVIAELAVPDTPSVTASPIPERYAARRQTEAERKAYLESDKQAETVEDGRVRCRKCQTWIILSDKQAFSTGKWVKHKLRCSDIVPSNRVAAAKRKLLVVNDSQAKVFDARRIECSFCGTNVVLQGEGDFNLTSWDEHKAQCTRLAPVTRSESVSSIIFPRQCPRPPLSTASTENTLIAPESVPRGTSQNLKRDREEPEATDEDATRPSARPRTETYAPPEQEAPSPFGWFLLPFQSFARGFRESLKNGS